MNNKYILQYEQYILIYYVSYLSLISFIYAIIQQHYNMCMVPLGVFITSINYWRKPDYSWRRYIDIFYVSCCLIYQIIKSYNSEYGLLYCIVVFIGIMFFPLGNYLSDKKLYWLSTYAHIMVHIIGNISNIILYSSKNKL
jgi:hypothetical protein